METSSRSLQRTASKRPLVGDVSQTGNKSLLYNLMGMPSPTNLPYHIPCFSVCKLVALCVLHILCIAHPSSACYKYPVPMQCSI